MTMRILHITPSYKPAYVYGGPIYSVSALCEVQASLLNEVTVFTTNANGKSNLEVELCKSNLVNGVNVVYFPRITKDHSHISPKLWINLLKNANRYEVIHLHSWWSVLMMGSALILYFKKVKFIISPRGMLSTYSFEHNKNALKKKIFFDFLSVPILSKQIFHATSLSEEGEIKTLFNQTKQIFTLPNLLKFPEIEVSKIEIFSTNHVIKLIFISRIDPKKGIELLLEALKILIELNLNIQLTIVGGGEPVYISELKLLASMLKIDHLIFWLGNIEWNEKFNNLLNANILVLPSYNENFANIILETLYVGRPVIVSKYVGLSDYVLKNNLGWVIDTKPDDIVKSVQDYVHNKSEWQAKALPTHQKIVSDFDNVTIAEKYLVAYKQFLNLN